MCGFARRRACVMTFNCCLIVSFETFMRTDGFLPEVRFVVVLVVVVVGDAKFGRSTRQLVVLLQTKNEPTAAARIAAVDVGRMLRHQSLSFVRAYVGAEGRRRCRLKTEPVRDRFADVAGCQISHVRQRRLQTGRRGGWDRHLATSALSTAGNV